MDKVPQRTIYEAVLESNRTYDNPFWDVWVEIALTSPSGQLQQIDAFWDGERRWRLRFSPDEVGTWHWRSEATDQADSGLHQRQGTFSCTPYEGDNPLYQHGPLRIAENGRYFTHADGKPFFWLSDTAWNGVLLAQSEDWQRYLQQRQKQGFTVIKFVTTQWRGGSYDSQGETAFHGTDHLRLNPSFFQRRDQQIQAINRHGLIAAPVMLWTLTSNDPGQILSEPDATRLARYEVARWGAYQVAWLLGGDGNYHGLRAERWKRIGRAVFGADHNRLATMHPMGQQWVADEFWNEPWFDFIGYQSGHGDSTSNLNWLVMGPPATDWERIPPKPVVNLEPNYEIHPSYHSKKYFTDFEVRRAAYWSLLVSPPAGVAYGHNSIWMWAAQPRVPEGHEAIGIVPPWSAGLDTAGIRSMTTLRDFFESIAWWQLRPAPELLKEQPGTVDPERFIAAAKSIDHQTGLLYLPQGGSVALRLEAWPNQIAADWFDPRLGTRQAAIADKHMANQYTAPSHQDWLLHLHT